MEGGALRHYLLFPFTSLLLILLSSACLKLLKLLVTAFDSSPLTIFSMLLSSLSVVELAAGSLGDSNDLSDLGDSEGDFVFCRLGLEGPLEPRFARLGRTASKAEPNDELLARLGGTSGNEYGANLCTPDARAAAFRWWFCCCCCWLLRAW